MKKGMRKWMALWLMAALLGGCGSQDSQEGILDGIGVSLNDGPGDSVEGAVGKQEAGEGSTWTPGENGEDILSQALSQEEKVMYEAYIKALEDVYFDQKLPGGIECDLQPADADMGENKFALLDIDADGKEELIISYTTTYTAGMVEAVYAYDSSTKEVREELVGFPLLTYYDNGIIEELFSHNHGMAGDGGADGNFWPYSLRKYDPDTDTYVPVGSVDAWSKRFKEIDQDGNPFPEEADKDGDGVVYYVMEGDYYLANPMDGQEYSQWRDSYLKGAKQVQVPYADLTTDNIYAILKGAAVNADTGAGNAMAAGSLESGSGPDNGNTGTLAGFDGQQILEQSFAVTLDGWGEVTFAPFGPGASGTVDDRGMVCFEDVRFALIKEGTPVFVFPGENEENVFYGQQFGQVLSVAFRDYNEDGRTDILVLLEYAGVQGPNIDVPFRVVRAFAQEEGEKEFSLDGALSEYLLPYGESMDRVYEGLADYAGIYSVATKKSAWEVDRFAKKVKRLILAGDFQGLSEEIAFPITIDGTTYRDKEAFLAADFIENTNQDFLEALRADPCGNLFVNYQGVMLGEGSVWITEVLDDNLASKGLKVYGMNGIRISP